MDDSITVDTLAQTPRAPLPHVTVVCECVCVCVRMNNSTYIAAAQTPRYDRSIVHVTIGLQLNVWT